MCHAATEQVLLRLAPDHASPTTASRAIVMQTLWRGYVARTNYAYVRDRIALLAEMVRFRRLESKFCLWYCNARWADEEKAALLRWQGVVHARVLCRKTMIKMWNAARGAKMPAWRRLWIITLERRHLEWRARPGDLLRWRRYVRRRKKRNRGARRGFSFTGAHGLLANRRIRHASNTHL